MGTATSELDAALTRFGVWSSVWEWPADLAEAGDAAAELESLGFGTVWIGASAADLRLHEALLAATQRLVVATGIVNIWTEPVGEVVASHQRLSAAFPGRLLLGIGSGHAELVEPATGQTYARPLSKLAAYLDDLDAADPPVPLAGRVLAALGPRALQLAAERSAGAHPYLVTPEHTADARELLGVGPLLAPEQKLFLGADADVARRVARRSLAIYLGLPNYVRTLRRYGFDDSDLTGDGSDRFVDGLVAWGAADEVAARVQAHLDAGADHVAVQVLSAGDARGLPRAEWRAAAEVLFA